MMNKFYTLCMLIMISASVLGQKVIVASQKEKVKNESVEGYTTNLDGKMTAVNPLWSKFLRDLGRVKLFSSDPVIISDPNFNGTVYPKGVVYANIFENDNQTKVWLGIIPKEWEEKDVEAVNKELEKSIYQFGVRFNRDKIQKQIDQTEEAVNAVERQKQRVINQGKDMTTQLANNEKDRVELEKSLEANKLENEALKIKLEKNKKAQDSLSNASIQIMKIMEVHKEALRKIN